MEHCLNSIPRRLAETQFKYSMRASGKTNQKNTYQLSAISRQERVYPHLERREMCGTRRFQSPSAEIPPYEKSR